MNWFYIMPAEAKNMFGAITGFILVMITITIAMTAEGIKLRYRSRKCYSPALTLKQIIIGK